MTCYHSFSQTPTSTFVFVVISYSVYLSGKTTSMRGDEEEMLYQAQTSEEWLWTHTQRSQSVSMLHGLTLVDEYAGLSSPGKTGRDLQAFH